MMRNLHGDERTTVRIPFAALIVPALALFIACGGDDEPTDEDTGNGTSGATATRTVRPTQRPDGDGDTEPTGTLDPLATVCRENPDPANDSLVQVDEPLGGDPVTSPVQVRGRVAAFEATFRVTIFDAAGTTIADVTGMSSEGQTLAPFEVEVPFTVTQETPACLWVYEASARDGQPIHVLQTPIRLQP
jgi:hypothetical protein